MADPLSVVSAIAGLVMFGSTLASTISTYIGETRSSPERLNSVNTHVSALTSILQKLHQSLHDSPHMFQNIPHQPVDELRVVLDGCMSILTELDRMINKLLRAKGGQFAKIGRRLQWVFVEKDIEPLLRSLEVHKLTISLTLNLISCTTTTEMNGRTFQMELELSEIRQLLRRIAQPTGQTSESRSIRESVFGVSDDAQSVCATTYRSSIGLERYISSLTSLYFYSRPGSMMTAEAQAEADEHANTVISKTQVDMVEEQTFKTPHTHEQAQKHDGGGDHEARVLWGNNVMPANETDGQLNQLTSGGIPVTIRICLVSHAFSGQSSLVWSFLGTLKDPESKPPGCTFFEHYTTGRTLTSRLPGLSGVLAMNIILDDVSGDDHNDRLRPLFYRESDLVIICFDLWRPKEQDDYSGVLAQECQKAIPLTPFVLVGCCSDGGPQQPGNNIRISSEEGRQMAEHIGALEFFETSAKTGEGVERTFQRCCEIVLVQRYGSAKERRRKNPKGLVRQRGGEECRIL